MCRMGCEPENGWTQRQNPIHEGGGDCRRGSKKPFDYEKQDCDRSKIKYQEPQVDSVRSLAEEPQKCRVHQVEPWGLEVIRLRVERNTVEYLLRHVREAPLIPL